MVDCAIMKRILPSNNTKLMDHLNELGYEMTLNNILFKWLLSLFVENTSEKVFLCIWDLLLLEGHFVLFKAIIGLLKLISKKVIETNSIEEIMNIFDEGIKNLKSTKRLRYYLFMRRYDFDMDLINNNRMLIAPKVVSSIQRIPKAYEKIKKIGGNKNLECDETWPYCTSNKNEQFNIKEYSIYKTYNKPVIYENYFFNRKNDAYNYKKTYRMKYMKKIRHKSFIPKHYLFKSLYPSDKFEIYKNMFIERQKHLCEKKDDIENEDNIINTNNKNENKNTKKRSLSCFAYGCSKYKQLIYKNKSKRKKTIGEKLNNMIDEYGKKQDPEEVKKKLEYFQYEIEVLP